MRTEGGIAYEGKNSLCMVKFEKNVTMVLDLGHKPSICI